jgi:hypothetical protein
VQHRGEKKLFFVWIGEIVEASNSFASNQQIHCKIPQHNNDDHITLQF